MEKQIVKTTATTNQLAVIKKDVVDLVASKVQQYIKNGELELPQDYSPNNAMKAAWLILQQTKDIQGKSVLETCTRNSIANALLDMVVQGLNPSKKQCYFIAYGNTLTCQRSYFGTMAVAKMVNKDIGDIVYDIVYGKDKFKYGIVNGRKTIALHEQEIENINYADIKAAYCIVYNKNNEIMKTEIMTFDEIKTSWKKSKAKPFDEKGNLRVGTVHAEFTKDMALRTVINKCLKTIINSSSDSTILLERINQSEEIADEAAVQSEIEENANKEEEIELIIPEPESEQEKEAPSLVETVKPQAKNVPMF